MLKFLTGAKLGITLASAVSFACFSGCFWLLVSNRLDPATGNLMLAIAAGVGALMCFGLWRQAHKERFQAVALFLLFVSLDMLWRAAESGLRSYFYFANQVPWYSAMVAPKLRALELVLVVQFIMVVVFLSVADRDKKAIPYFNAGLLITATIYFLTHVMITVFAWN